MATYRPSPRAYMLCEKTESVGNTRLPPQAKMLLALLKRKAF